MVKTPWRRLLGISCAGIVAVGLFLLTSLLYATRRHGRRNQWQLES